jgi:hypothetical protein
MATMLRMSAVGWFAKSSLGDASFVRHACHDVKTSADERQQSSHLAPQDERKTCAGTQSFRATRASGWVEPQIYFDGAPTECLRRNADGLVIVNG